MLPDDCHQLKFDRVQKHHVLCVDGTEVATAERGSTWAGRWGRRCGHRSVASALISDGFVCEWGVYWGGVCACIDGGRGER